MKRDIKKHFSSKNNTVFNVTQKGKKTILYDWPHVRFPLKIIINYIVIKIAMLLPLNLKVFAYRHLLGMKIGRHVSIAPEVEFDPFYPELIELEDDVVIGQRTIIFSHEFVPGSFRFAKVSIKKGALVGAMSTVRSGVTIGANSMVAMCSFVNKDIPAGETWGGVPAKFIKKNRK
jgi:acetyltransferase-like isoleucine patch superfamily enzyme